MKYSPKVAARTFIKKHFPNACVAFLGGSAAHRNLTPNSDLDIVAFDARNSLFAEGIRSEARDLMSQGPCEWTWDERNQVRYHITECLEDLSDAHL
jgi:hypothetical protein